MTLLALLTEPPRVHVVFRVTGTADHGRLEGALRSEMTLGAADLRMRSG
jgi:hypothetical protein